MGEKVYIRCLIGALLMIAGGTAAAGQTKPRPAPASFVRSKLEIMNVVTGKRHVIYTTKKIIEAPNWSHNGKELLFNSGGHLYRIPITGGTPVEVNTGSRKKINNDHGISPDGRRIAMSDQTTPGGSEVYVMPMGNGRPRLITHTPPSYFHGWAPNGKTLAFVGERHKNFDIYSVAAAGGTPQRLTTTPAQDDGPDYAPDGRIYYNSARSGVMQIWRMNADGSHKTRITHNQHDADWFPHPSPNGKWLVFMSYRGSVVNHPPDKHVWIRMMPLNGSTKPHVLARLFGGQGTMNTPDWSSDSSRIAFVSYSPLPPGTKPDR